MSDEIQSLTVGEHTYTPSFIADGRPYQFKHEQLQFLMIYQRTKNLEVASQMVGKDVSWARQFIKSKKFMSYLSGKLQDISVKNGMTEEQWYRWGRMVIDGKVEKYEYVCDCGFMGHFNSYELESMRDDEMVIHAECHACFKSVIPTLKAEKVEVTREQMEAWKEIGQRIIPKIERVHHAFEKSEFVFEGSEENR